jgi:hypothetical protein
VRAIIAILLHGAAIAHADCPPEHAAMGHCVLEQTPDPAAGASDITCSHDQAAKGECTQLIATAIESAMAAGPMEYIETCSPEHAAMGHCVRGGGRVASSGASAGPSVGATTTVRLLAANYRSPLFEGSYQGTELGASISRGRLAASASLAGYRLVRNGLASQGIGDVMVHVHAEAAAGRGFAGGAMLMASLPTGDSDRGFGMGHVMLMPELWGTWNARDISVSLSAGYCHALGGEQAHAQHGGGGSWPLVAPMNARELSFGGSAMYSLSPAWAVGVSSNGATPIGDGRARLITGGRIVWMFGRLVTAAELAGGVVGDPFGVRGMLSTTFPLR